MDEGITLGSGSMYVLGCGVVGPDLGLVRTTAPK